MLNETTDIKQTENIALPTNSMFYCSTLSRTDRSFKEEINKMNESNDPITISWIESDGFNDEELIAFLNSNLLDEQNLFTDKTTNPQVNKYG
jgi:hypothetical protein